MVWSESVEKKHDDDDDDDDYDDFVRCQPVSRATSSCSVRCKLRSLYALAQCVNSRRVYSTFRTGSCRRFARWQPPEKCRPVYVLRSSLTRLLLSARRRSMFQSPFHFVLVVLVVQWFGVRLVIERSLVQLPAGAHIKSTRSTQPSIPPGWVNRVPASMAGVRRGVFTCK